MMKDMSTFWFEGEEFANLTAFNNAVRCPLDSEERAIYALENLEQSQKTAKEISKMGLKTAYLRERTVEMKSKEYQEEIMPFVILEYKITGETPVVYWKGQEIKWRSPEHYALIKDALRAKFKQNPEAYKQLMSMGERKLVHDTGRKESPNTSLPTVEFTSILTELREEFQPKDMISPLKTEGKL
jgi:hypothetical protein